MKYPLFALVLLTFMNITCCAESVFDVESLPCRRTKQYQSGSLKNIVVFSAPRTGSSLIYNVFRFLFEDDSHLFADHHDFQHERVVRKTHKFSDLNLENDAVLYIFPIRHPISACISNLRICPRPVINYRAFAQRLVKRHSDQLIMYENMHKNVLKPIMLKYEDFTDDFDYLFDLIEDYFSIEIDFHDKEVIKKGYSKENICLSTNMLMDFNGYLPVSGFHGKHIALEKFAPPDEFLYWLNFYLESNQSLFSDYGYYWEKGSLKFESG